MSAETATVEVLTAEVRTLMVGSRQVTLSVFKQLDTVLPKDIEPFGRVRDGRDNSVSVDVVGRDRRTGALVRSYCWEIHGSYYAPKNPEEHAAMVATYWEYTALPLIVLAGLR
jgi:hypothetical protein